jgi:hypothetical protein
MCRSGTHRVCPPRPVSLAFSVLFNYVIVFLINVNNENGFRRTERCASHARESLREKVLKDMQMRTRVCRSASVLWLITSKLVRRYCGRLRTLWRQREEIGTRRKNSRFQRQSFLHSGENCVITLSYRTIQRSTGFHRYGYVWLLIVVAIENFKRLTLPFAVIDRQSERRFTSLFLMFNVDFRWKQSWLSRLSRSDFV